MRVEGSITAISWIPSEAITGIGDAVFRSGFAHYDVAPPDALGPDIAGAIEALRVADRFRFANLLSAFATFDDAGACRGCGYDGGGRIGATTIRLGRRFTVAAVSLADRSTAPEVGDGWVRFRQTTGGRTGLPAPRPVRHPPFVQFFAPIAWTTLELTLYADGRTEGRLVGASPFPRHWLYDTSGTLVAKSGMTDFKNWAAHAFGRHTPWGDEESPALVTAVETALERELSTLLMHGGAKPRLRSLRPGETVVAQGEESDDLYLLLDGVLAVDVDGTAWAEVGPGAVLGERAALEDGIRTATLRAVTPVRLGSVPAAQIDRDKLTALSAQHRREEQAAG